MKTASRIALAAVASVLLTASLSFAQTRTVPVGYMTYPVVTGATTSFGVPLLGLPTLTGIASTVTSTTIGVTGVTWTPNQFAGAGTHYFVAIKTGAQAGRALLVLGNTSNALTLDVEDTNLNASGFAVTAAVDTFELFQGHTLASLFGSTADGSGFLSSGLKGGATSTVADAVQVYIGTSFVTYFFNTTLAYWVVNGGTTNQNDFILYPDDGLLIIRRGPNGDLTMSGRVPATRLLTKLPGGTSSVVAVRFPADTTLGGLNFAAPGTWLTGANTNVADTVGLWSGGKWVLYFKNTSNQWIKDKGNSADQSATVIPAGKSIQILKRGSATGSASFFSQSLPYSL